MLITPPVTDAEPRPVDMLLMCECTNKSPRFTLQLNPQTNYALRLIDCLSGHRNFPLPRSACPIYFITMNEWLLGHDCVHIIYRSNDNNYMT